MAPGRPQLGEIARAALRARGFEPDYSAAVLDEVARLPAAVPVADRRDLRNLLWTSIDNDDSRDLDQLTVADARSGGVTRVLVGIADVAAHVAPGTAIDDRAARNTTSVYTAAAVFPMLPEQLSTDRTSLNPGGDRAAIIVQFDVAADGTVGDATLFPALVRNHAQLAYDAVGEWLDGHGSEPARVTAVPNLAATLRRQDSAAQMLRRRRRAQGALTLDTREIRTLFDGEAVKDLADEHPNRAKELIEEFMIAANTASAAFLAAARRPSIRRVVRTPKRWDRIVALARQTGGRLPVAPDSAALAAWLRERQQAAPAAFRDLSLSVVKLIGRGEYVVQRPGDPPLRHFGLALEDYTHATAPNRRFADLATQRLLKAALAKRPGPYAPEILDTIARRCTERESAAGAVERQVRKSAAALLLADRVGEVFDALVTGVTPSGTWVRLRRPAAEGRLEEGSAGLDVGDTIQARLLRTDVPRGFVDFARA